MIDISKYNFPDNWYLTTINEIFKNLSLTNIKIKKKDYLDYGNIPVIDQGCDLIGGYTNNKETIVKCKLPVIIFGDHTKIIKYIDFEFSPGADGIKVLQTNFPLNVKLLYYFLQIIVQNIPDKGYARHYQYMVKSPIPLPPLPEQHRIVAKIEELFSELDAGVAALKKAKSMLETYRQAVLKAAFEGRLTEGWRKFNYLPSKNELYEIILKNREIEYMDGNYRGMLKIFEDVDSNDTRDLVKIPESWIWIKLGNISTGVEYGSSKKSKKTGRIPVIRMGNIQNGRIVWNNLIYSDDEDEISKYFLSNNDILFNRTNSPELVGKTGIYKGEQPAIFAGYLIRINQIKWVNADFLNYYLNTTYAKRYGEKVKSDAVNQSNINGNKLSNYPIPLTTRQEQDQIVKEIENRLIEAKDLENKLNKQNINFQLLKQSVLKRAFCGQLVPQNPNDEPAEKLLERIKN